MKHHASQLSDMRPDPTFGAFGTTWPYCLDTGLLTRVGFLDRAGAELRRSQRYGRPLALCRIAPLDPDIDDEAFNYLTFFVQESVRDGMDLAGLVAPRSIAVLLPESDMTEAMDFTVRLRSRANESSQPAIADFTTRETILRDDDECLSKLLQRCA